MKWRHASLGAILIALTLLGSYRAARLVMGHHSDLKLEVRGGTHKVLTAPSKGGLIDIAYELVNNTSATLSLNVIEKSCGCIQANIVPPTLPPGGTARVTVTTTVPSLGKDDGGVVITGQPLTSSRSQSGEHLTLTYEVEATIGSGLHIEPPVVSVQSGGMHEAPRVLTLVVKSESAPTSAFILGPNSSEFIEWREINPWTSAGLIHTCILEVQLPSHGPSRSETLTVTVGLESGEELRSSFALTIT